MKKRTQTDTAQLGFDLLLAETDQANEAAAVERATGHLPSTMEEALPFYRGLIERHHAAMMVADIETAIALREEVSQLASRLNKGEPGILAGPDAPGCRLEALTRAEPGVMPLWGQEGSFMVEVAGMRVAIEMDGMFGIGACYMPWMNFSARVVDRDKLFLSETGYRSFLGMQAALVPGLSPDDFVREVIAAHVAKAMNGKLVAVQDRPATVGIV